ncbi:MAG: DUF805 domain-containing protein [Bacteroidales bacterium]|nr:DUF805 domain-containing protein [Bacteroidales bacterium]
MFDSMFKRPFSFKGRIKRLEYFLSFLISWSLLFLFLLVMMKIPVNKEIMFVFILPLVYFMIAQRAKRLHDLGLSAWMLLLIPVPVINVGLELYMLFAAGSEKINEYDIRPVSKKDIIQSENPKLNVININNKRLHNGIAKIFKNNIYIKYFIFFAISVLIGSIFGWYFRKPSVKLLDKVLNFNSYSNWESDLLIERYRADSFKVNLEYFDFNWVVFFLISAFMFFLFLLFRDKSIRNLLINKFRNNEN